MTASPSLRSGKVQGAAPRRGGGLRLLLVEDYDCTAEILGRLLRRAGYYVTIAGDIEAARQFLEECPFDLLISDIGLPDGSGLELMEHVRACHGIPGIAVSGFGAPTDVEASLLAGFSAHMVKPVEWRRLDAAIQEFGHAHTTAS